MLFSANMNAQNTCTNAITLSSTDSIIQLSTNDSIVWFIYQASTSYLDLKIISDSLRDELLPITQNVDIKLYSGNCGILTEIVDLDSLTSVSFINNNLSYPNNYYIKVQYKSNWNPVLYIKNKLYETELITCDHNCNLLANVPINVPPNIDPYAPFYYSQVPCWYAGWGTPQITTYTGFTGHAVYLCSTYSWFIYNGNVYGPTYVSESFYQPINIEPLKTYHLNFSYSSFILTGYNELYAVITNANLLTTGTPNAAGTALYPIPNLSNTIWSSGTLSLNSTTKTTTITTITTPSSLPSGQYKLLFYTKYSGYSINEKRVAIVGEVSLTPEPLNVILTHSNTGTICPSDPVTLTATVSPQSIFPYTYTIYENNTVIYSNTTTSTQIQYTVHPSVTTNYTLVVKDIYGCTYSASYEVPVFPIILPTLSGNQSACLGTTETYITDAGNTHYIWFLSGGGTVISGGSTHTNTITINWNTIGQYTLQIYYNDVNGCLSLIKSISIWVMRNPIINAGEDITLCENSQTMLSIQAYITPNGTTSPYTINWTDQNHNFISYDNPLQISAPTTTTTYIVKVTALNGCSATDDIKVTILIPEKPIIEGNKSGCNIDNNLYTITNYNPNTTYTWSLTNNQGTISSAGDGSVIINWYNNEGGGCIKDIIVVTAIDANGCRCSTSFNVYDCCRYLENTSTVSYNSTTTLSGTQTLDNITGYNTNEDIIIDEYSNITFYQTYIRMGPSTKIIVKPNAKLTIDGSIFGYDQFDCCNEMWDGIYVSDVTSEVEVINSSIIKNAINGIVSDNNGKFTLNNANFIKNLYNVRIKNYFISSPTHSGTIKNTRFYGSILTDKPCIGQKTICGVETSWLYSLDIGDETNINYRNEFKDMCYGIYASNSSLKIVNNSFNNISNVPPFTHYNEGAVYATNSLPWDNIESIPSTPFFDIYVGGNGIKRNYFENCKTGIYSYRYNNTIHNNDFKHCDNGIRSVDLADNSAYTENIIWDDFSNGVTNGFGIDLRNTFTYPDGIMCLVESNHVINKYYGINLINISGDKVYKYANVNHNLINYTLSTSAGTAQHTGIWLQNCHYAQVKFNDINRNIITSPSEAEFVKGIRISECREANIFQNYMYHMGSGIYTNGLLSNTQFTCNDFNYDHYGILFGSSSQISNQGKPIRFINHYNPYNQWDDYNPYNSRLADLNNVSLLLPGFKYYYDPNGVSVYDPTIGGVSTNRINPTSNIGANYLCVSESGGPLTTDPNINADAREIAYGQIVRDEKFYGDLEEEYRKKDREYVYEMLRSYPELINMGNIDDNLYLNFYNNLYQSDLDNVIAMKEAMYEQNFALAKEKIANIASDDGINSNRKIASSIYLNTWAKHKYELSEEQEAALTTLAYLTPYAGGDAVYTARVMLDINPDDINVDFAIGPPNSKASNKELSVFVYPNPARDNLNLKFNDIISNDGSIEIYGMMGNLVYTSLISKGTTEMQLNVNSINSGLYYYTIKVNNNKINSGKITIINN